MDYTIVLSALHLGEDRAHKRCFGGPRPNRGACTPQSWDCHNSVERGPKCGSTAHKWYLHGGAPS